MGFIFLFFSILLLGTALWLWIFHKEQLSDFIIDASLVPVEVSIRPPKRSPIALWFARTGVWLLVLGIIALIVSIYLLIKGPIWSGLIAFILAIVFLSGRLRTLLWRDYLYTPPPIPLYGYVGETTLPKKVYVGDSQNISVDLKSSLALPLDEVFSVLDRMGDKHVSLQIRLDGTAELFLEVELLAAGFSVDGEKKQRRSIKTAQKLSYRWNCYFPNSGNLAIALAFRVVSSSDIVELGAIEHVIRVVQLDHLTQRQIRIMGSIAVIAGFISTVIGIVTNIPSLFHIFGLH